MFNAGARTADLVKSLAADQLTTNLMVEVHVIAVSGGWLREG